MKSSIYSPMLRKSAQNVEKPRPISISTLEQAMTDSGGACRSLLGEVAMAVSETRALAVEGVVMAIVVRFDYFFTMFVVVDPPTQIMTRMALEAAVLVEIHPSETTQGVADLRNIMLVKTRISLPEAPHHPHPGQRDVHRQGKPAHLLPLPRLP